MKTFSTCVTACISVGIVAFIAWCFFRTATDPEAGRQYRETVGECLYGEDHTFPGGMQGVAANCHLYGFTSLGEKPSSIYVTVDDGASGYVYPYDAELAVLMRDKTWEPVPITVDRKTNSPGRVVRLNVPKLDAPLHYLLRVYLHPRTDHKLPNVTLTRWVTLSTVEPPAKPL